MLLNQELILFPSLIICYMAGLTKSQLSTKQYGLDELLLGLNIVK